LSPLAHPTQSDSSRPHHLRINPFQANPFQQLRVAGQPPKKRSKLNLTDDQKSKITPIIADRQTQMRALMADSSGRRLQKARKAKSIMSGSDKKIEAVLTGDQKKTYEQMKKQPKEQSQERGQQNANSDMQ
jgi:hypothetical protein